MDVLQLCNLPHQGPRLAANASQHAVDGQLLRILEALHEQAADYTTHLTRSTRHCSGPAAQKGRTWLLGLPLLPPFPASLLTGDQLPKEQGEPKLPGLLQVS